jgi:Cu(I)/Ag(I) efflux system membrane fusion protein
MKRAILAGVTVAALFAAAGGGFIGVRGHLRLTDASGVALVSSATAQTGSEPIYYQDPDGAPLGRAGLPGRASRRGSQLR